MGIGFQLVATVLLGYWAGDWIDAKLERKDTLFTILLSAISIFAGVFMVVREVLKK